MGRAAVPDHRILLRRELVRIRQLLFIGRRLLSEQLVLVRQLLFGQQLG
jgi:hypothetical protein